MKQKIWQVNVLPNTSNLVYFSNYPLSFIDWNRETIIIHSKQGWIVR